MSVLLREETLEEALAHVHPHQPGTVVQSSLGAEFEEQLEASLREAKDNA